MNALIVFACLAAVPAALSSAVGSIVAGPPGTGVVTNAGAISPAGLGLGLVGPGLGWNAGLVGPAVVAAPALGWGGLGLGGINLGGVGLGGLGLVQPGLGVVTNGGGVIGIGKGGVAVRGPPTVPATIVGPSGKIVADGLWGPTLAVGKVW